MDMTVYYHSPDKTLKSYNVADVTSVEEGQQLVLSALHESQEVFLKPLMSFIKGGLY